MENKQDLPEIADTPSVTSAASDDNKQDKGGAAVDVVAEQLAADDKTKAKSSKAKKTKSGGKKKQKYVSDGVVHVFASFNNTIITITDHQGNTLGWATAGTDFKGSRKSTPYAAQVAMGQAVEKALAISPSLRSVDVVVKGPGPGRDACIRVIAETELKIKSIRDITPIAHNGCRPPKQRRV